MPRNVHASYHLLSQIPLTAPDTVRSTCCSISDASHNSIVDHSDYHCNRIEAVAPNPACADFRPRVSSRPSLSPLSLWQIIRVSNRVNTSFSLMDRTDSSASHRAGKSPAGYQNPSFHVAERYSCVYSSQRQPHQDRESSRTKEEEEKRKRKY